MSIKHAEGVYAGPVGGVLPAAAVERGAGVSGWLKWKLTAADKDKYESAIVVLNKAVSAGEWDVRKALVSDQLQGTDTLHSVSERLLIGGRLGMAVAMESIICTALDYSASALSMVLGYMTGRHVRRKHDGMTPSERMREFENATLDTVLRSFDRQRPYRTEYSLADQTCDLGEARSKFGRRLFRVAADFRTVQIWGLTQWLESWANLDHHLAFCAGLFGLWCRLRRVVSDLAGDCLITPVSDGAAGDVATSAVAGEQMSSGVEYEHKEYEHKGDDFATAPADSTGTLDWLAALEEWRPAGGGVYLHTSRVAMQKLMDVVAVLLCLKGNSLPVIFKTPVIAHFERAEDDLLNLRFELAGPRDGDDSFLPREGRGADVEHFLDRNAKLVVGDPPSVPSLCTLHLCAPVSERLDHRDSVLGFIVLPPDFVSDDRFENTADIQVAKHFTERVLIDDCYSEGGPRAPRKWPASVSHLQTHYSQASLAKLQEHGLFMPLSGSRRGEHGGVTSWETLQALRKEGRADRVTLMPVVSSAVVEVDSTVFTRLTAAAVALVEQAALFERSMLSLDKNGMKIPKTSRASAAGAVPIAMTATKLYRTHPLSFMRAAIELGERVGGTTMSDMMKCIFSACALACDDSVTAVSVATSLRLWRWRELAVPVLQRVIAERANLLCVCVTRDRREQCNDLKLSGSTDVATVAEPPCPVSGGGVFSGRRLLGRKLAWTLEPVPVAIADTPGWVYQSVNPPLVYSASLKFDGGDWFCCMDAPASVPRSMGLDVSTRVWYSRIGFRVFGRTRTSAVEDVWHGLIHMPTARRERVPGAVLKKVEERWAEQFEVLRKACYGGLKQVDLAEMSGGLHFRSDIRESEARAVFEPPRVGSDRTLPIAWKVDLDMAVVRVRCAGDWTS